MNDICGWVKNGGKCILEKENQQLKKMVNFGGITIVNCPECNKEINVNFCRETEEYRKKYQQLKDNWNKLKEWLEEETMQHWNINILDKMQELEKGNEVE